MIDSTIGGREEPAPCNAEQRAGDKQSYFCRAGGNPIVRRTCARTTRDVDKPLEERVEVVVQCEAGASSDKFARAGDKKVTPA